MTSREHWARVREVFELLLEADPPNPASWLAHEAANDDATLHEEVLSLLKHHARAGAFLVEPARGAMAELLADDHPLEPGQKIGAFTILREAGRGGMGRVYMATDSRLQRTVALKALRPELSADASHRERLRREARAAAGLSHPGICTIYAIEEIDNELYIVAEFVEGHTMREEIPGARPPTADEVRQVGQELAAAIACAHAAGILHRDLKPENVMRAQDGHVKILDFGLARVERPAMPEAHAVRETLPGTLLGTPGYIAPEQIHGDPVDGRADLFALGVLLYEYAAGRHPFIATSSIATVARVLEAEPPPLAEIRPDLSESLVRVIERCMQKSPADRFAQAADVAQELSRRTGPTHRSPVVGWWRTHQAITIALYFVASVVTWQLKDARSGMTLSVFLAVGVLATIAGVFRGHLLFTERVNGPGLGAELQRTAPVTITTDLLIAAALLIDGALLVMGASTAPLPALLTMALGVGIALTRLLLEPSTTTAAFRQLTPNDPVVS